MKLLGADKIRGHGYKTAIQMSAVGINTKRAYACETQVIIKH